MSGYIDHAVEQVEKALRHQLGVMPIDNTVIVSIGIEIKLTGLSGNTITYQIQADQFIVTAGGETPVFTEEQK